MKIIGVSLAKIGSNTKNIHILGLGRFNFKRINPESGIPRT